MCNLANIQTTHDCLGELFRGTNEKIIGKTTVVGTINNS